MFIRQGCAVAPTNILHRQIRVLNTSSGECTLVKKYDAETFGWRFFPLILILKAELSGAMTKQGTRIESYSPSNDRAFYWVDQILF